MGFSWLEVAIVAAILLILSAAGLGAYNERKRPTIEIKKDEWDCIVSEKRTHLQTMIIEKMTMLQPITSDVCVEYRRHKGE